MVISTLSKTVCRLQRSFHVTQDLAYACKLHLQPPLLILARFTHLHLLLCLLIHKCSPYNPNLRLYHKMLSTMIFKSMNDGGSSVSNYGSSFKTTTKASSTVLETLSG